MPGEKKNGWNEYSRLVLSELERLDVGQVALNEKMNKVLTEIALLKVKSGVWGLLGGAIPVAIGLGLWLLKGG